MSDPRICFRCRSEGSNFHMQVLTEMGVLLGIPFLSQFFLLVMIVIVMEKRSNVSSLGLVWFSCWRKNQGNSCLVYSGEKEVWKERGTSKDHWRKTFYKEKNQVKSATGQDSNTKENKSLKNEHRKQRRRIQVKSKKIELNPCFLLSSFGVQFSSDR